MNHSFSSIGWLDYQFENITGFELDPDIELLYEQGYVDFGEHCILLFNHPVMTITYNQHAPEEAMFRAEELVKKIYGRYYSFHKPLGTIQAPFIGEQISLMPGIKNNRLWVGQFDSHTRKQLREWIDPVELGRTIELDTDQGPVSHYLSTPEVRRIIDTEEGWLLIMSDEGRRLGFIHEDKLTSVDLDHALHFSAEVHHWYNNTLLFHTHDRSSGKVFAHVYAKTGEPVYLFEYLYGKPVHSAMVPVDYTHVMEAVSGEQDKIVMRDLSLPAEQGIIWQHVLTGFPTGTGSFQLVLLSENGQTWEMKCTKTIYGKDYEMVFFVDLVTGRVIENSCCILQKNTKN